MIARGAPAWFAGRVRTKGHSSVRALVVAATLTLVARGAGADAPDGKVDARQRFEEGLAHAQAARWADALAAFLESRRLYPTRYNTQNAAIALRHLGRVVEALDLLESMAREFPEATETDRAVLEAELSTLRASMALVRIEGAPAGATVTIDGVEHGSTPLGRPLRVAAGERVVVVERAGFERFEQRVTFAGGTAVTLQPTLRALPERPSVRVVERSGRPARVVVDGAVVGETPWEGSLSEGVHVVALVGDGELGTEPLAIDVHPGEAREVALDLEALGCAVSLTTEPANATLELHGVRLGEGAWAGRLRCGRREFGVVAAGHPRLDRVVEVVPGRLQEITLSRSADDARASRWLVGAELGLVFADSLGGGAGDRCSADTCRTALGVVPMLRLGRHLGASFALSAEIGWASLETERVVDGERVERRAIRGPLIGIAASHRTAGRLHGVLRLALGALPATIETESQELTVTYAHVSPELRVGYAIAPALSVTVGARSSFYVGSGVPTVTSPRDVEEPVADELLWWLMPAVAVEWAP